MPLYQHLRPDAENSAGTAATTLWSAICSVKIKPVLAEGTFRLEGAFLLAAYVVRAAIIVRGLTSEHVSLYTVRHLIGGLDATSIQSRSDALEDSHR